MEKFRYPISIKVFAFTLIGLCGALHFGTADYLILPVTFAMTLQSGIVLFLESRGIHLYYQRFFGVFIPSLFILALYGIFGWDADYTPVFLSIYMAIACGTVIVDGLCNFGKASGKKDVRKAFIIGILHGCASLSALMIREALWI